MFTCHQRDAAEINGQTPTAECACLVGGQPLQECAACHGLGIVDMADPRELPERWAERPDETPEWARDCGGAIRAWSLVQRYGVEGWLALDGAREADPLFVQALAVLSEEYARLEHLERVEEGKAARRKQKG